MTNKTVRLTPEEIRQQQAGSVRIAPGIWMDRDGHVHWSIVELLELVDLEDTPDNRAAIVEITERVARAAGATQIIRQEPQD